MSAAAKQQPFANVVREESSTPSVAQLYQNQKVGHFVLHFSVDGDPVKPKCADGYLAIKPRGHSLVTRHFIVTNDGPALCVKDVLREVAAFYNRSSDYKVVQVHYKPQER